MKLLLNGIFRWLMVVVISYLLLSARASSSFERVEAQRVAKAVKS